ncbi:carboxypeptidase-like regulatory domain-containing protein [Segetibacter sp. 3557_3]|uniref:carboxypeptidase-like regulatory domain-containing protein n=1 Tax=Segetibacter sp. 3557_3 TaxID=2547429 RepID=UPI001058FF1C|nr:carboxypeptidase-like regulatory domain-containing protein [Segetibacter sp. 3557_3]TDH25625.1 carboxypeptidase-like regulatory domain-containing protein [Segetibacter sp. 3557_3]
MAEKQPYNYNDIRRYLGQQMTPEEMHLFEKAMMNDPFLADALDGYQLANNETTKDHLAEIEKAIKGEKERAKVVPITRPARSSWLKIAVVIVVLAGAALVTFRATENGTESRELAADVAAVAPDSIKPNGTFAPTPQKESVNELLARNLKTKVPTQQNSSTPLEPGRKQVPPPMMRADALTATEATRMNTQEAIKEEGRQADAMVAAAPRLQDNRQGFELRGKVVDNLGNPVTSATVAAPKDQAATLSDSTGNFRLRVPDSTVDVTVSSAGYATVQKKLYGKSDNNVLLQKSQPALNEVVIGSGRKNTVARSRRVTAVMADTAAVPVGGWEQFQAYFYNQLRSSADSIKQIGAGEMELEFRVDPDGTPRDIKLTTLVNRTLEVQVGLILERGPKWMVQPGNSGKRVRIRL